MSQALVLIYFFYGLSFFAMGLAVLLETGRSPALAEARSLRFLAAFGIVHGTHEWLESYLLQAQSLGTAMPAWLGWFRLTLLLGSFIALFFYAYTTLQLASSKASGQRFFHFDRLAIYEVLILASFALSYGQRPPEWLGLLDALARYMLAVPAAAFSALALYAQARRSRQDGRAKLWRPLIIASASFAAYAAAQVFVHAVPAFPARYISQEAFLAIAGFPIQAVRALAAIAITYGLLRAVQEIERERQEQLETSNRLRLEAIEERDALRRDLLRHVVRSQEEERARVSRELHDEIAQMLSGFTLELAAMRTKMKKPESIEMVDHLQALSRQMSQSLYRLVRDLRPANLDDLGLVPALNTLIAQDCPPKGMAVELHVIGEAQRLNPLVETAVFRVVQEALNNVCRHAGVNKADVTLDYRPSQVSICVSDKGAGFDATETFRPPRGWGLAGMRERVEALAGELRIVTAPGTGTTVEVVIPLHDEAGKEPTYGQDHFAARGRS